MTATMTSALIALAALSAIGAIGADWNERRSAAYYFLKPLTTILIFAIAATQAAGAESTEVYRHWILLALALSLAGDVCLMFEGNRWFIAGLGSFLLAHLAFVCAFLQGVRAISLPFWLAAVAVYAVVLLVIFLPRAGALKLPVLLYCAVLALMVFAAAARNAQFASVESVRALLGALLFMLSDSLLGWRRFVGRYRHAQAAILSTYWLAIGLIAASA